MKIAIQGFEGSFHQAAAQQFFGAGIEVLTCATFADVVTQAQSSQSDGGIMAIENSIAGSILPNYSLLQKSSLAITGEIYLKISQHLLVNPDVELQHIREVHSHPMALLQCGQYLSKRGWKLVETQDTALSARHVHLSKSKTIAAVAGHIAAKRYGLHIIAPGIQDQKANYTRFLVLQPAKKGLPVDGANKASLLFETDHSKGSLAKVLTAIAKLGINLSKLQSVPIPTAKFRYSFHADMEFGNQEQFEKALKKMEPLTKKLQVYGIYKKGKTS